MSDIKGEYKRILEDLENSIKNENDLKIVKEKVMELTMVFMDIIDRLTYLTDERIKDIEEKQIEINNKIDNVQTMVDGMEDEIYEGQDDEYEFEIVCPYCNYEFTTDIVDEKAEEIKCPKCNNIIELDWNSEEEFSCGSGCMHCMGGVAEDGQKYNPKENKENKNEDEDM